MSSRTLNVFLLVVLSAILGAWSNQNWDDIKANAKVLHDHVAREVREYRSKPSGVRALTPAEVEKKAKAAYESFDR